ncbi:PREDICTED: pentatricopeptide repeat-containing protein At2g15980 [Tarenaya hassleriana]|uniref:pentatricopeptide repeat-containing protein At2g15980 n=1 Tax=Tarenaya hassleriana TaxID=28532 RepID=UPI00053C4CA7|nr:PREDICTED: pentatricopeptide repeat-containing protein At2g15980 [Tarenaya hassleriana]
MSVPILRRILDPTLTRKPGPESAVSLLFLNTVVSPPSDRSGVPAVDTLVSDAVSILTHHRSKSRWSTLRSLFLSGFTAEQFSEIAIRIRNNPHLALRFFLFTRRHSLCPHDLHSCTVLVHILARSRLRRHACELTRLAVRLAGEGTVSVSTAGGTEVECVSMVLRSLIQTYNRCGSAPFVFDLLIKSCLDSKLIDGAVMVMRKLRSKGISPQISTCNALVAEVCRRRGAYDGCKLYREVFGLDDGLEEAVKWVARVKPNAHTFNSMMVSFYREGEMEMVEEIWREMEEVGCCPNSYSYSVLMEMYCRRGMVSEAEKMWEEMRIKGLNYDIVAYNTLIGGLCRSGETARAEELVREMGSKGIESTSMTYEHLVRGYCKVKDMDSAMLVYRDMRRKSFWPEGSTIEALVEGLCEKQRVEEASEMMKAAGRDFGFCPNQKCYMLWIKGLCREGKMEKALSTQAEMVGRGFGPNRETYEAFIHGYVKAGDVEMAALLRKEMAEYLEGREEEEEEGLS